MISARGRVSGSGSGSWRGARLSVFLVFAVGGKSQGHIMPSVVGAGMMLEAETTSHTQ